jgi:protease-4
MKDFLKNVLATVVGIFLFMAVTGLFMVMSIIGMVASGEQTKSVKDNSVLVMNLSGILAERGESNPLSEFMGNSNQSLGLDDMLAAIKKAKSNDKIKGIYIEAGAFSPDSYASLQALRRALSDFRKSGKWIVAYADTYTQGSYYLASVADHVWLNPQGQVDWHGLAAQKMYFKGLMEKFGVKMQVAKVGSYKSAVEQFINDKMSDADREQTEAYINGIWQQVTTDVAASRKLTQATLNEYADSLITLSDSKQFVTAKLVDKLLYTDQVKAEVKKLLDIDEDDDINQLSIGDMKNVKDKDRDGEEIAVYYAYGNIVDGNAGGQFSREHVIDAQVVCKDLEELMDDDDVKAVVLRINSGGGSAYASEQIWHQIMELKKKKPVVVSMGGMAASGGYYISAPANWIIAEPTTLTGSIGIFGMFPDMSGLLTDKLGLRFDEVKTNKYSALGTNARPFTADEMAHLESYIDRGYKLFRQRVADGRKLTTEQVEAIAQGHVWLGKDALSIRLVDQLGSLDDAVAKAAKLAKLDEYHTNAYPGEQDWFDSFMNEASNGNYLDEQLRLGLGVLYEPFLLMRTINSQDAIQARVPYYINIR